MIVLYSAQRFCLVPALQYLVRSYPAAAGQVLRTQLGKGKLAGVRLRPAARGVAAVPALGARCAQPVPARNRKKKRRGENPPSALAPVCLPAFDPVIYIAVLDHRIGPVTGYDDMIEDQYADPVEQALELKR